jgi:ATP-dependent Clp protease protease subunit
MAAKKRRKSVKKASVPKKKIAELIAEADPQPLGRVLYLTGEVTEESVSTLISEIIACVNQNKTEPITLIISTEGGSVDDMFSLYDIMKFVPCPIYTVGLGKVMSAGVLILSSGQKGGRLIGKHATVMVHPISDEIDGDIFQIANALKESQKSQKMMEDALLAETKMTAKQLEVIMRAGHDTYLTPDEAVKMGIVDKIIG